MNTWGWLCTPMICPFNITKKYLCEFNSSPETSRISTNWLEGRRRVRRERECIPWAPKLKTILRIGPSSSSEVTWARSERFCRYINIHALSPLSHLKLKRARRVIPSLIHNSLLQEYQKGTPYPTARAAENGDHSLSLSSRNETSYASSYPKLI